MSGFFKKLFNRIVGKTEAAPPAPEPVALPAPEPVAEDDVAEVVAEVAAPPPAVTQEASVAKPAAKKPPAKIKEPKKPEARKPETRKAEVKKPELKKPEPKKPEPKKPEARKPEPKKAAAKAAPGTPAAKDVAKVVARVKPVDVAVPPAPPAPEPPPPPSPEIEVVPPPPPTPVEILRPLRVPDPVPAPVPAPVVDDARPKGWLSRLTQGLSKSSKTITGSITAIFTKRKLDAATLQELEDTLIQADLGVAVSERIIKAVATGRYDKEVDPEEVKQILADEVSKVLRPVEVPFNFGSEKPYVILVVGVNGSGKTTTIGKLGAIAAREGFKVMFAACDTFRAAAIEQLTVWGKRIGAETISRPQGADAAGLAFDAMKAAAENGTDIVFIDTAGRLHNKAYLMDELDKVVRVIKKYDAAAPHAVLLVLDATTGQNALAQAEAFTKVAGVTGLIMTKLDGTARGGILVAIAERFRLPIHAIGVGESIDDLQPFDAQAFSRAIAGLEEH